MADTTFTNGATLTDADWFNDLNRLHYTIFGDPADDAAARSGINAASLADNAFTGLQTMPAGYSVTGAVVSGYGAGAGAAVVQATSKSTAVTINKPCGKITTHAENLAAGAVVGFTVNNSLVTADDVIVLTPKDGNGYKYRFSVYSVSSGSFIIAVKNDTAGDLAEALPLNFAVIAASES